MSTIYSAFNLNIRSQIPLPLPKIEQTGAVTDISIEIAELIAPEKLLRTHDGVWYAYDEDSLYLRWDEIGAFLLENGNRIILSPAKDVAPDKQPVVPLLGSVIGALLQQRGMMVIHGSCVSVDGKAVIFVGRKGQGKSTFAGYFIREDHPLVADDVCAISVSVPEHPLIHPSFSTIRLWPDAMKYLKFISHAHEKVHPEYEKRIISFESVFLENAMKVEGIYVLSIGPAIKIELLEGIKRVQEVMPHLIINRFAEGQPESLRRNLFSSLTERMQSVPVYRLTRPRDKKLLPKLADLVISTLK